MSVSAIEAASRRLADGLKLLQAIGDIKERRRVAATDIGRLVGELDRVLEQAAADRRPSEKAILEIARNKIVTDAANVLLGVCQWKVEQS
jgi:hypothetical protein